MPKTKEKSKFTENYKKLEELVKWFEQDDIDLEAGIGKFEEGTKLVKELKEYLNTMENKIKELKKAI